MKNKEKYSKKDVAFVLCCVVFLLMNIGAIGSGGRRRAKDIICLSNLHQWGKMFELFTNNNDGYFMEGFTSNNRWIRALGAYHKYDTNFSCCPEATKPWFDLYGNSTDSTIGGAFMAWGYYMQSVWIKPMKGSYGINGWVNNPDPGREPSGRPAEYHWRTPNVKEAANVPLFLGCQRYNAWPRHTDTPPDFDGQMLLGLEQMMRVCVNRHNGTVSHLFTDWSARKIGLKQSWTLKWHRKFNTNGPWTKAGGVQPSDWPEWMTNFKDF